jgi:hypothetical protein
VEAEKEALAKELSDEDHIPFQTVGCTIKLALVLAMSTQCPVR